MIDEIYDLNMKVGYLTDEERKAMEQIKEFLKNRRMISSTLNPELPSVKAQVAKVAKKRGRKPKADVLD